MVPNVGPVTSARSHTRGEKPPLGHGHPPGEEHHGKGVLEMGVHCPLCVGLPPHCCASSLPAKTQGTQLGLSGHA